MAAACLAVGESALAEDRQGFPGSPGPVFASKAMVERPYGRPALLGAAVSTREPVRRETVIECATDARQEGELTVPYACVVLPEWPSSGTPFSIEDESRRRFEGQ